MKYAYDIENSLNYLIENYLLSIQIHKYKMYSKILIFPELLKARFVMTTAFDFKSTSP